jgi:hypothetical protein
MGATCRKRTLVAAGRGLSGWPRGPKTWVALQLATRSTRPRFSRATPVLSQREEAHGRHGGSAVSSRVTTGRRVGGIDPTASAVVLREAEALRKERRRDGLHVDPRSLHRHRGMDVLAFTSEETTADDAWVGSRRTAQEIAFAPRPTASVFSDRRPKTRRCYRHNCCCP